MKKIKGELRDLDNEDIYCDHKSKEECNIS